MRVGVQRHRLHRLLAAHGRPTVLVAGLTLPAKTSLPSLRGRQDSVDCSQFSMPI